MTGKLVLSDRNFVSMVRHFAIVNANVAYSQGQTEMAKWYLNLRQQAEIRPEQLGFKPQRQFESLANEITRSSSGHEANLWFEFAIENLTREFNDPGLESIMQKDSPVFSRRWFQSVKHVMARFSSYKEHRRFLRKMGKSCAD